MWPKPDKSPSHILALNSNCGIPLMDTSCSQDCCFIENIFPCMHEKPMSLTLFVATLYIGIQASRFIAVDSILLFYLYASRFSYYVRSLSYREATFSGAYREMLTSYVVVRFVEHDCCTISIYWIAWMISKTTWLDKKPLCNRLYFQCSTGPCMPPLWMGRVRFMLIRDVP